MEQVRQGCEVSKYQGYSQQKIKTGVQDKGKKGVHRVRPETIHRRVRILKMVVQEVNGSRFKPKPKNNS